MGLFSTLIKAAEDGNIENTLSSAIDKLEVGLDKTIDRAEKVVSTVEQQTQYIDGTGQSQE